MTIKHTFLKFSPLLIFTVHRTSMLPTLSPGQKIVVWRLGRLQTGDVVVCKDPHSEQYLVKRIVQMSMNIGKKRFFLEGDNKKLSIDSRKFGWITEDAIIGKVIYPRV